jgi:hypothetical protein
MEIRRCKRCGNPLCDPRTDVGDVCRECYPMLQQRMWRHPPASQVSGYRPWQLQALRNGSKRVRRRPRKPALVPDP